MVRSRRFSVPNFFSFANGDAPSSNSPVVLQPIPEDLEVRRDPPRVRPEFLILPPVPREVARSFSFVSILRDLRHWPRAKRGNDVLPDHAVDDVQSAVPAVGVRLALLDIGFPCLREGVLGLLLVGALGGLGGPAHALGFVSWIDPLGDVPLPLASDLSRLSEAHGGIVADGAPRRRGRARDSASTSTKLLCPVSVTRRRTLRPPRQVECSGSPFGAAFSALIVRSVRSLFVIIECSSD